MERNQDQAIKAHYAKVSSLLFLREQDKMHKMKMKKQSKMIRRRKFLKKHIDGNNNIFQMLTTKFNRKSAQNIIWEKNYKLKMAINILKEENSSIKAKLWNIEKENRKMDKQIEAWNLEKVFTGSKNKPYIDMMTVSKVFADQDYQIVSTKIDIAKFQRILQQKQNEIERLLNKSKDFEKYLGHFKHIASQAKCKFLNQLSNQNIWKDDCQFQVYLQDTCQSLNKQVVLKNQHAELIKKNIEIKRKVNNDHASELQLQEKQAGSFKKINQDQIDSIKQEMRRIKLQQKNNIKDFKKDLKKLKNNTISFECEIQSQMEEFIKQKIQLHKQIDQIMKTIEIELGGTQCYKSQILPAIAKINN